MLKLSIAKKIDLLFIISNDETLTQLTWIKPLIM